jgi:hypothetical protein
MAMRGPCFVAWKGNAAILPALGVAVSMLRFDKDHAAAKRKQKLDDRRAKVGLIANASGGK